jgi:predicted transcriptional regulator
MKKIENIENYIISIDSDAYHCLPKFEINNAGTLLVMKKNTVVGTITDGDIRKVLIKHRLLSIPVKDVMKNDYKFGLNESECDLIFKTYPYIFITPQVSENRELIQLFQRDA